MERQAGLCLGSFTVGRIRGRHWLNGEAPACTGSTSTIIATYKDKTAHPRSRGEHPGEGRRQEALTRLADEALNIDEVYGTEPQASYVMTIAPLSAPDELGEHVTLPQLLERLRGELSGQQA
jgi:hypothetical protein